MTDRSLRPVVEQHFVDEPREWYFHLPTGSATVRASTGSVERYILGYAILEPGEQLGTIGEHDDLLDVLEGETVDYWLKPGHEQELDPIHEDRSVRMIVRRDGSMKSLFMSWPFTGVHTFQLKDDIIGIVEVDRNVRIPTRQSRQGSEMEANHAAYESHWDIDLEP